MFVGPVCVRSTSHSEEAAGQCKGSAQLCHHPLRPPSLLYVLKSAHPARTGQCRTACAGDRQHLRCRQQHLGWQERWQLHSRLSV